MKKIVMFFLTAVLLVTVLAVPAMAATGSKIDGPEVVRPGDTVMVIFSAGKIYKGAYSGSGTVSYDSERLTLQRYTPLLGENWSVAFFENEFTFQSAPGTEPLTTDVPIFSATFVVNPDVPVWSDVTVAVGGIVLFDGEMEVGVDRVYWSRSVSNPLSKNADLSQLAVENFFLSPSFTPERQNYAVYLPYETDTVSIQAETADRKATVAIPAVENIPVGESAWEIPVTAENGDVRTYTLTIHRADSIQNQAAETEPATEPTTEPATEPTVETTAETVEETEPTEETKAATTTQTPSGGMSKKTIGVLWILSIAAAFVGGLVTPMILGLRD